LTSGRGFGWFRRSLWFIIVLVWINV